ncbi:hypothetical protein LJC25_04280 [Bacteroidales bacterium OttesenSCG-928-K03]|nr:hypothetical protein [Odoribacter sp. OttesenSCG-928-L07]MDL2242928.1 hypothetical protein [Bacteroidales bacterium OttesenSCG-928-K03]
MRKDKTKQTLPEKDENKMNYFYEHSFVFTSILTFVGSLSAAIIGAIFSTVLCTLIGALIGATICFFGGRLSYLAMKQNDVIKDKVVDDKIKDSKLHWGKF